MLARAGCFSFTFEFFSSFCISSYGYSFSSSFSSLALSHHLRHGLFLISAGILDRHSLLNILLLQNENRELQEEIAHYEKQYNDDSRALELMDVSPEAVEKVARVKLFMKKANEDVYVVVNEGDN